MRTFSTLVLVGLFAISLAAEPQKPAFKLTADEQAVLDLTNAERKKQNLEPLKANELLTKAAREHSANMAKQHKLDHELDGKKAHERFEAVGYAFRAMAENIAMGQRSPAEAVRS